MVREVMFESNQKMIILSNEIKKNKKLIAEKKCLIKSGYYLSEKISKEVLELEIKNKALLKNYSSEWRVDHERRQKEYGEKWEVKRKGKCFNKMMRFR